MLTIVCVRWGDKFSKDYVNILHSGIRRNLDAEFRFVCVTDDPDGYDPGVETVKIPDGLTGWWGKLWLFSDEFQKQCGERIWFFDLDTIITGSLDDMSKYQGEFIILRDFYRHEGYGSGLMAWKRGFGKKIWDMWEAYGRPMMAGGDQEWIEHVIADADLWQEIYPGEVCSYKAHAQQWPPNNCRIVCFHGTPMPHQCEGGWVEMMWKTDGVVAPRFNNTANTTPDDMLVNVRENVKLDIPWFQSSPVHNGTMVIVGGSPSLKENYKNIRDRKKRGQTVVALNGTLDNLIANGIAPDYMAMMDARQANVRFVKGRHDVKYLINAVCHPDVFKTLNGKDVTLWHSYLGNEEEHVKLLQQYDHKPWGIVGTGNTVGLTMIVLGYYMGFRKFHLYGMDSSYADKEHHAYSQDLNDGESVFTVWADGKPYKCSAWMMKQANDFQGIFKQLVSQGCQITAHGNGLLPDICRHLNEQWRHYIKEQVDGRKVLQN